MAGSKKAVRAALREEKRKRLGEDKDVIDEAAVEEEEEDGATRALSTPRLCMGVPSLTCGFWCVWCSRRGECRED